MGRYPNPLKVKPGISVVICCYNSARVIRETIGALSQQEIPANIGYEVILVDNNCTDNTVPLASEVWGNTKYPLIVVKEEKPGLIFARKAGVKKVRYSILLFVDDDNILNPDWILKLYQLYNKMPEVGLAGGYNEALIQGKKPTWFDQYQLIYACGPRADKSGKNSSLMFGAGLSFRTEVIKGVLFSSLPPFLVGRTKGLLSRGEDTEMALRCRLEGWDFYYDSSLRLKHVLIPERVSWKYVCRARKGGAVANMILKIYWNLLGRQKQWSYFHWFVIVIREWWRFFMSDLKNIFHIKKIGSRVSFQFNRLQGMTKGLFVYLKSYHTIQTKILEYYKDSMTERD